MVHEENEEKERDGGVEESKKKNLIPFLSKLYLSPFTHAVITPPNIPLSATL